MYPVAPSEALQLSFILPSGRGHADRSVGALGTDAAITSTGAKKDNNAITKEIEINKIISI